MIQITVAAKNSEIQSIEISGHSGSAEHGKDLVCAAVSAVSFGLCNAFDQMGCDVDIQVKENRIRIEMIHPSEVTQTVFQTGLIQFETIREQNSDYVKIRKMEV